MHHLPAVMMIRRLTALLMTLLYVGVAAWIGVIHQHQDNSFHSDQCAACTWQLNAVTDSPVIIPTVEFVATESPCVFPSTVSVTVVFVPTSASRDPPEASA